MWMFSVSVGFIPIKESFISAYYIHIAFFMWDSSVGLFVQENL